MKHCLFPFFSFARLFSGKPKGGTFFFSFAHFPYVWRKDQVAAAPVVDDEALHAYSTLRWQAPNGELVVVVAAAAALCPSSQV
jgi:hypothetical protein